MRIDTICKALARLLMIVGVSMLLPAIWAVYFKEQDLWVYLFSAFATVGSGIILFRIVPGSDEVRPREGFAIVALGWLVASLFGSVPYLLTGTFDSFIDAFFETVSGFTTTGSTVLTDIEVVSRSTLVWRSLTQWLGGMGIVVLFVAILSQMGAGAVQMFKAESPGPVPEKIKPRIRETAKILWLTYLLISLAEMLLLWVAGMSLFDAMNHTFTTMATGGYSTRNASVGFYTSPWIQWIIIVFMFLAGANFALYYQCLRGKNLACFWRNEEFRLYLFLVLGATALTLFYVYGQVAGGFEAALRASAFQVVSMITTTGYATADFDKWPLLVKTLLVILMFVGGCAGSTGGAIKVGRVLVLLKQSVVELKRMVHPRAILPLLINQKPMPSDVVISILQFFFLYTGISSLGWLAMSAYGMDLVSGFTAVAATLGNVGPGLGTVGPAANFAHLPAGAKVILSVLMLVGRLEVYTVLVLLAPQTWRK
ncbi:potassium transporter [Clostridiales bacterium PH28_bin88]|nr:potassium transporter [Clostridiales bacterium PH28_bin88]